jgi:alpha/beta hydrolase family protein
VVRYRRPRSRGEVKPTGNVRVSLWRRRFGAMLALAAVVGATSTGALARSSAVGSVSPLTDPHKIARLAAHAYVWGLAPEFEYRFGNYNNLATAPRNTFAGGNAAAAWNKTSGGAHLAAATLLRLRDTNDPAFTSIIGAHFDSGPYDVAGTPSQRLATEETLIVTPMWLEAFRELAFPGRDPEMLRDPAVSPLYAELSGLPPAMFVVGALDPLLDDSLFMAARWQAAGNQATVQAWPEGAHTFMNMGTPLADAALARTTAWISGILR